MTIRIGISITDSQTAIAVVEATRVKKVAIGYGGGDLQTRIESVARDLAATLEKRGREVKAVHIASTSVRSALRSHPSKVALVRLSAPEGRDSPPLIAATGVANILADFAVLPGGHGEDARLIGVPNETEISSFYSKVKGADAFVVSSPFSILEHDHEEIVARMLTKLGAERVWQSSEVSYAPCILDRESTALLSASGSKSIEHTEQAVLTALKAYGCKPFVYFARNDGNLIGGSLARRFPLDTAWGFEAHSAVGAARLTKRASCIVAGSEGSRTWLAGVKRNALLTRSITYFESLILHVKSPVIVDFDDSLTDEMKRHRLALISELSGAKATIKCGDDKRLPFRVERHELRSSFAAINATFQDVTWNWGLNVRKGTDLSQAKKQLQSHVLNEMKRANCKPGSVKLDRLRSRPGTNLPEGTTTLVLQASGETRQ